MILYRQKSFLSPNQQCQIIKQRQYEQDKQTELQQHKNNATMTELYGKKNRQSNNMILPVTEFVK